MATLTERIFAMYQIYFDVVPVGWREMTSGGFAREILAGKQFQIPADADRRIGITIDHNGEIYVVTDILRIAGEDWFTISNGKDFDNMPVCDYEEVRQNLTITHLKYKY